MSDDKKIDKAAVREELRRYSEQEVTFTRADPDKVREAAANVRERHAKTIKELADR